MRVDELRDLGRQRLPVVDQLAFGDQLADPRAYQVNSEHGPAASMGDNLCRSGRLQDDALAVAAEIVCHLADLNAARGCSGGRYADGRHLGVTVGHPRHAVVVDGRDRQSGETLGDRDALAEADVRKLQAGREVTDGGYGRNAGLPVFVDYDETSLGDDSGLLVA